MKEKEKITITPTEFAEAVHKSALKWKKENLKESSSIAKLAVKIQGELLNLIFAELFEEAEDAAEEAEKETKANERGEDINDGLSELEECGILPKGFLDAIKRARGKGANIHVEVIGVKKK